MTTPTTHYAFPKPIVNADSGTWGVTLNNALDAIDAQIFTQAGALGVNNLTVASTPGSAISGTLTFVNGSVSVGQQKRWILAEDTATEGGGNSGSNLSLSAYSDTGTLTSTPIAINRATGGVTFGTAASFTGATTISNLNATGTATFVNINATGTATLASATVTGAANVGSLVSSGSVTAGPVNVKGATQPTLSFQNSGGTAVANIFYTIASSALQISNVGFAGITLDVSGDIIATCTAAGNFIVPNNNAYKTGGGSWQATSDERIKTVLGDYEAGLDEVLQLRPITYVYKGNDTPTADGESRHQQAAQSGQEFVGFVAQELEQIMPNMVSQHEGYIDGEAVSDLRSVDISSLVYALVNSVRQLKAEIEALKR